MCVRRGEDQDWSAPPGLTFRDWLRGRGCEERPPTMADLAYHLSTLFPPVRPQGHLEVRFIDAQLGDGWIVLTAVVSALADDPVAAQLAMAAAEEVSADGDGPGLNGAGPSSATEWHQPERRRDGRWARTAPTGAVAARRPGGAWTTPVPARAARDCFEAADAALARAAARRYSPRVDDFAEEYVLRGRCPADDTLEAAALRRRWRKADDRRPDPDRGRAAQDRIAGLLTWARQRTRGLTDCVTDDDLIRQHSPLMSPLVWDLAHVANQEELWLLREVAGRDPMHPEIDSLYDAFEHPRAERPTLPLMLPAEARSYAHEVRGRVLDVLERVQFRGARLLQEGFAYGMIAQHEQQHDETMLASHQLRVGAPALSALPPALPWRTC
jgi:hypothetical protein